MLILAVLISATFVILACVGGATLLMAAKDIIDLSHPNATVGITIAGLLGSAYGISIGTQGTFAISFGYYMQMLGWTFLFFIFIFLLVVGLMALMDYLG